MYGPHSHPQSAKGPECSKGDREENRRYRGSDLFIVFVVGAPGKQGLPSVEMERIDQEKQLWDFSLECLGQSGILGANSCILGEWEKEVNLGTSQ